jgi:hypothetical protein
MCSDNKSLHRVNVIDVKTVQQKSGSDFVADSNFNSQASEEDAASVLELLLNVTLSYYPPEPDGWREWSIYLKSWIESFGNTMVDIFTSAKNPQVSLTLCLLSTFLYFQHLKYNIIRLQ